MGHKLREQVSGGGTVSAVTEYSYDLLGHVKCATVRMNPAAWGTPLADPCVPGPQGSQGPDRVTHNVWDASGQLLKVQKAYGTPLQQDYATYEYSPNGKQTSVTDANGNRAELAYDGLDRQVRWTFPSKTSPGSVNAADYEAYTYDANANRTSLRKRDGSVITYSYDALNRVAVKTVPASATGAAGYSVYTGYDNRNLMTYARFGSTSGAGITNVYDGFGGLTSSTTNMDGTSRTLASAFDPDVDRTQLSGRCGLQRPLRVQQSAAAGLRHLTKRAAGMDSFDPRRGRRP
jgi:YD repeat-containing protein